MPIYHFTCVTPGCAEYGRPQSKLLERSRKAIWFRENSCGTCGGSFVRTPTGPSAHKVDRIDTGTMARVLERPANINEMVRDHEAVGDERMMGSKVP